MTLFRKMLLLCSFAFLSHNVVFARPAARVFYPADLTDNWIPRSKSSNHEATYKSYNEPYSQNSVSNIKDESLSHHEPFSTFTDMHSSGAHGRNWGLRKGMADATGTLDMMTDMLGMADELNMLEATEPLDATEALNFATTVLEAVDATEALDLVTTVLEAVDATEALDLVTNVLEAVDATEALDLVTNVLGATDTLDMVTDALGVVTDALDIADILSGLTGGTLGPFRCLNIHVCLKQGCVGIDLYLEIEFDCLPVVTVIADIEASCYIHTDETGCQELVLIDCKCMVQNTTCGGVVGAALEAAKEVAGAAGCIVVDTCITGVNTCLKLGAAVDPGGVMGSFIGKCHPKGPHPFKHHHHEHGPGYSQSYEQMPGQEHLWSGEGQQMSEQEDLWSGEGQQMEYPDQIVGSLEEVYEQGAFDDDRQDYDDDLDQNEQQAYSEPGEWQEMDNAGQTGEDYEQGAIYYDDTKPSETAGNSAEDMSDWQDINDDWTTLPN